ncbi:unnamed protein product [Rhodiola kirilowii]
MEGLANILPPPPKASSVDALPSKLRQLMSLASVPKDFVKVAEAKFMIKVDDFFRLFFSDEGVLFVESFHKTCGDTDFKCTEWCPSDKFGHVREVSFLHPIKIYLGAKSGSCRETQKFRLYRNSHLIVETSQEVTGVPYADYFTVEGLWDVENDETVWKGKIVQSTLEECREAYAIWINIAHDLLKKKHLEKQGVAPTLSLNEDILDQICSKSRNWGKFEAATIKLDQC